MEFVAAEFNALFTIIAIAVWALMAWFEKKKKEELRRRREEAARTASSTSTVQTPIEDPSEWNSEEAIDVHEHQMPVYVMDEVSVRTGDHFQSERAALITRAANLEAELVKEKKRRRDEELRDVRHLSQVLKKHPQEAIVLAEILRCRTAFWRKQV
jgi:Flp pilus assembly protein TadB